MTNQRPPLRHRWEYQLVAALLGLLLTTLQARRSRPGAAPPVVADPEVRDWIDQRRTEQAAEPWRTQVDLERSILRALTGLWLAWRCYRLEGAARRPPSSRA